MNVFLWPSSCSAAIGILCSLMLLAQNIVKVYDMRSLGLDLNCTVTVSSPLSGVFVVLARCIQKCESIGYKGAYNPTTGRSVPEVEKMCAELGIRMEYADCYDGGCELVIGEGSDRTCVSLEGLEAGIAITIDCIPVVTRKGISEK